MDIRATRPRAPNCRRHVRRDHPRNRHLPPQTDSWPSQLRAIDRWRDNGALYAIAIDPQQHRVEHRSTGTLDYREQFEAVLTIAHIIAGP